MSESRPADSTEGRFGETQEARHTDMLLCDFVRLANSEALSADITLLCSGTVISGRLIGILEYFSIIADDASPFSNWIRSNREGILKRFADPENPDKIAFSKEDPLYIHLRDVIIYEVVGVPNQETPLLKAWRGMLTSIDGFSLGVYTCR